ncbi:pregnancy-associated plasma protein-A [Christiangramia gaetbulicola]|uniref:Pregnancy-associated plasma protein-A n=1 Tax=Christiangramia gaetbulicola TaxID=703340 RepID=A0A2T6AHQ9_9FLAO|nr:M43 family zinc metalloprotease [Christiangramia gaetbulicola]PTX43331.1 pregnancy-associated plasma protein-A [Christiangramia gaetbulicola]
MKKVFLGMAALAFLFASCEQDPNQEITSEQQEAQVDMSDFYLYTDSSDEKRSDNAAEKCYSMKNLNRLLNENKGLHEKMYNIEKNTRSILAKSENAKGGKPGGGGGGTEPPVTDNLGVVNIPVVVHVVYSNAQQNISDQQINSQIDVLNADFRASNNDVNSIPSEFANDVADSEISFTLAAVNRYSNSTSQWGTNDAVKAQYPPVNPSTTLNIWVANIGGGILGYAQFPGGPASTDGVVISPQYFGTTGYVSAPFDRGRTATHEVGHYLNLRHIWGDGRCRQDDFVADTPDSDGPNYGCPSYPTVNCRSTDMTMNYMDYTNDACMYMFSEGQKARMRTIFMDGGPRTGFVN